MRRILAALFAVAIGFPGAGQAQGTDSLIPERRLAITENVDFYGGDLKAIFDTTFEACRAACLTEPQCRAFTFNARAGSCFPKTNVTERQPYDGAISAVVIETSPDVQARAEARRADLDFLNQSDFESARSAAAELADFHKVGDFTVQDYVQGATNARNAGNWQNAVSFSGAAVVLSDAPELWVTYAEDLLDAQNTNLNMRITRAFSASINGYVRADQPALRARALLAMSRALEGLSRGQTTIPALRLAQSLTPRDDIARALDRAVENFGFRIVEHEVESDSKSPRICAQFSETLAEAGTDYAPFVQMQGSGYAVDPSGNRLCISGLRHGERYEVTFREGLPAASGEVTQKDYTLNLYVQDRTAQVTFPGRAYILPKSGEAAVPVSTVNAEALDLALYRVGERNFVRAEQSGYIDNRFTYWRDEDWSDRVSDLVWQGEGVVENVLNEDVTTRLPLGDVIEGLEPGLYQLQARIKGKDGDDGSTASQSFLVSDLGLATMGGTDGLHVFVRSLTSAEPVEGAKLTLLSVTNNALGELTTDSQGYATFPAGLTRGTGGAEPSMVTVEMGEDIAFLSLEDPEFDLSDRGVEGREPAGPIDLFLATDRGAYRPGDTIHVTTLARDAESTAIDGLPLTAILTRPDGVEYSRTLSNDAKAGGHVFNLAVSSVAPRGSWTIAVHADTDAPPLTTRTVLVEDFLPERIDFTQSLPEGPIAPTDFPELSIEARYLFGAPAGDLPVETQVRLQGVRELPDYPGFTFGRFDEPVPSDTIVAGGATTDAQGKASFAIEFPDLGRVDRPLKATLVTTVSEGSGRPVERRLEKILTPAAPLIGIKPGFEDVAARGAPAQFQVMAVGSDGQPAAMPVKWELNRLDRYYYWYRQYGNWRWEPVTNRTPVTSGTATLTPEGAVQIEAPVDWGYYELRVERADGTFAASSVDFYAGWYAPADASATPDTLELSLDQPAYKPGDTATVTIVPRFAGKGLVTVVSNKLIAMQPVDLTEGTNTLTLPVTEDWGTGAYVTATIIRPMDVDAGRNPARALGLAHASVDPGAKALTSSFEVAAESSPRAAMPVALKVEGIQPGETAYATIAAVDVGILNLTGFKSPDPESYYFGQRKLGIAMRDVYGRLIDGMNGDMGEVRSGGDALVEKSFDSPPPTEELVAYFSGPIEVGADGYARTSFDMPSFNGTVRLMAVTWSKTGVGSAEADVLVRDPVVVTASVPRFLTPGDESRLLLEVVHATGPTGRMGLDVSATGVTLGGGLPSGFDLGDRAKAVYSVPLTAGEVGNHTVRIALTTPDGKQLVKDITVPVITTDPEIARQSRFTLAPGQTFSFDEAVFDGFHEGTGTATIAAGTFARFDVPGLLRRLDQYPYGCTEQVTSTAMPLLYFQEVSEAMGLAVADTAKTRVEQAITRVLTRQASNGSFGLWYAYSGDMWLDAYVTDFLSRARAKGYDVPDLAFRNAMDNLRNQVNYYPGFDEGGQDLAYALFVLAREGAAAVGDLRYYADVKGDAFATPMAAAQLGAALAAYGDSTRADAMFARAGRMLGNAAESQPLWRADYGTRNRDAAAVLALAAEAGSQAVNRDEVANRIAASTSRFYSTQESVWTLLAARALISEGAGNLTVDGVAVSGPLVRMLEDDASGGGAAIRNEGSFEVPLVLTTFGVPSQPEPADGNGWRIARRYYTTEGTEVSPETVKSGTRLVAVVEVTPLGPREGRLMVNDPLPAGFEIDNPNLLAGGDIRALDWLDLGSASVQHSEFRSERFLSAVDHYGDQPFRLAYIVRAVSPGTFHHPAASVEDMYRPEYRARTAQGSVTVTE